MHTFSPAKDVDPRPLRSCAPPAAPGDPGQCRDPLGQHRHGLHEPDQAAHGDRGIRVYPHALGLGSRHRGRSCLAGERRRVANWVRAAGGSAATNELRVALRRQHAQCGGHGGDKTEAERRLGVSVNTWSVDRSSSPSLTPGRGGLSTPSWLNTASATTSPPSSPRVGITVALRRAREEIALRTFLEERGEATTNFERSRRAPPLPGLAAAPDRGRLAASAPRGISTRSPCARREGYGGGVARGACHGGLHLLNSCQRV